MSKRWKVILSISLAINLVLGYLLYSKPVPVSSSSREYVEKIDSLEFELFSIQEHRYKVEKEIDTVYVQLETIKKEYVETYNNIVTNSPSDDYCFFIEYLERNSTRLDSIDHF